MEEVGELSHAFLKHEQGIRGMRDPVVAHAAMVDAVGDICIYLASFCNANHISLGDAVESTWEQVRLRDWQKHAEKGVA